MTFNRTFRTIAGVAAVAVATAFGAGVAFAQPHGHHGHGGPGDEVMIGQLIAHAKDKLSLNTMQQQQFDTAVAHSKAAWQAELAKPEPDLAAVAAAMDAAADQARVQRNAIRAEWLSLYATFTPDQKAVVRDLLKQRVARMESFHEKMREHMRERAGAKAT